MPIFFPLYFPHPPPVGILFHHHQQQWLTIIANNISNTFQSCLAFKVSFVVDRAWVRLSLDFCAALGLASVEIAQSIKKINSVLFLAYCFIFFSFFSFHVPFCTHFCGNRNRFHLDRVAWLAQWRIFVLRSGFAKEVKV